MEQDSGPNQEPASRRKLAARLGEALKSADDAPRLVTAARLVRQLLPGDSDFGDPLSTAGAEPAHVVGRAALRAERRAAEPARRDRAQRASRSGSRSRARRGAGDAGEVAILFTDLVDFSSWALKAGDTTAIELLRVVGDAIEPAVTRHEGVVVKRLGDGLMAVFDEPGRRSRRRSTPTTRWAGSRSRATARGCAPGVHFGKPRTLGGDYLGVDVNIAARVAGAASGGEVLVSEAACERIDESSLRVKRRRFFRAKGAPSDLKVFAVARDG